MMFCRKDKQWKKPGWDAPLRCAPLMLGVERLLSGIGDRLLLAKMRQ
jgi:hypothetical protein